MMVEAEWSFLKTCWEGEKGIWGSMCDRRIFSRTVEMVLSKKIDLYGEGWEGFLFCFRMRRRMRSFFKIEGMQLWGRE